MDNISDMDADAHLNGQSRELAKLAEIVLQSLLTSRKRTQCATMHDAEIIHVPAF